MSVFVMVIVVEVGRNAQIPEIFALLIYVFGCPGSLVLHAGFV